MMNPLEAAMMRQVVAVKPPNGLLGSLTPVGWHPPGRGMTYAEFEAEGMQLALRHRGSLWGLGDWLNYGDDAKDIGEKYVQAADSLGYNEAFLRKVKWVSRSVPMDQRQPGVSFSHHATVASIKDPKVREALLLVAGEWELAKADFEKWVAELKANGVSPGNADEDMDPEKIVKLAKEKWERPE